MTNGQYPGVYVQELPTSGGSIQSVSTNNTVFVGVAEKGPLNTPVQVTSWNQYVATFGGLVWGAQMPFGVFAFFAQGGSLCHVVRAEAGAEEAATLASLPAGSLTISAATPGAWGDSLAVTIGDVPAIANPGEGPSPGFAVNVFYKPPRRGAVPTAIDALFAAYARSNPLPSETVGRLTWILLESFAGFSAADLQPVAGGPSPLELRINQASLFVRVTVTGTTPPPSLARPTVLAGGTGEAGPGPARLARALAAVDSLTDVSLLCAPDTALITDLVLQRAVIQQVVTWCEARPLNDLFYIADSPIGLSVEHVAAFKTGAASPDGVVPEGRPLQSPLSALYYPWIVVQSPVSNTSVTIAPSGAMAGLYTATDNAEGVWRSAAGVTNGAMPVAQGVERTVTDADQDILNPKGINAIRPIINYGICAYGARTMSPDLDKLYIGPQRLLTMIQLSVRKGLQWVAFEPSSPQLWASVSRSVDLYLTDLWRSGALFGSTAAEACGVICDVSNNPPDDQNAGLLNIQILAAPVYPAEFVVLYLQLATMPGS